MKDHLCIWDEAVLTANYLRNRLFSESCSDGKKTPYEAFTGNRPDLSFLRIFGSRAFVHIPKVKRSDKLSGRAEVGILVWYNFDGCYRILVEKDGSRYIRVSKDVDFDEAIIGSLPETKNGTPPCTFNLPSERESEQDTTVGRTECIPSNDLHGHMVPYSDEEPNDEEDIEGQDYDEQHDSVTYRPDIRRSGRATIQLDRFSAMLIQQCLLSNAEDPLTLQEALASPEASDWKTAMNLELEMISRLGTWSPAFLPEVKRVVRTKWVFNRKRDSTGKVVRYRARLCAKGYSQKFGLDYDDVFAPVARYATFRFLISLKVKRGYNMMLLDVKHEFLNGKLDKEVYIEVPEGVTISSENGDCFKLHKAMNGLKQAARA